MAHPTGPGRAGAGPSLRPVTLRGLVLAAHAAPAAFVTALACALSVGIGAGARTTVLVTTAVLAGQLSVGWSNDWIDADRDRAVGRSDKPVGDGRLAVSTVRTAALVALV